MCLFLVLLFGGARIGGVLWWLFEPNRWEAAFDSWVWPVLGLIFLPWTTIMFVGVAPFGTVTGWDWMWLGLAFFADILSLGSQGYGGRSRYATRGY